MAGTEKYSPSVILILYLLNNTHLYKFSLFFLQNKSLFFLIILDYFRQIMKHNKKINNLSLFLFLHANCIFHQNIVVKIRLRNSHVFIYRKKMIHTHKNGYSEIEMVSDVCSTDCG